MTDAGRSTERGKTAFIVSLALVSIALGVYMQGSSRVGDGYAEGMEYMHFVLGALLSLFTPIGWIAAGILAWLFTRLTVSADSVAPAANVSSLVGKDEIGFRHGSLAHPGREMDARWARALEARGVELDRIERDLEGLYMHSVPQPGRDQVFRAFSYAHPSDIRVVVLGQDPYPEPGVANGLAFSVRNGEPIPSSLAAIYRAISSDPRLVPRAPQNGSLKAWAKQGVLLLNAALTVEANDPGSHLDYWSPFTLAVLQELGSQPRPMVFLAFGDRAVGLVARAGIPSRHLVIEMAHPVAWARTNLPKVTEALPFHDANAFLWRNGRGRIDW